MQAVRGKNTRPELTVRRMLHAMGYRYRLHVREMPGSPDLVFPARRAVIEVRGCYWHRHPDPGCRNAVLPATRREWWRAKLEKNVARDHSNEQALRRLGWSVLVVWECEVLNPDLHNRLTTFLGSPKAPTGRRCKGIADANP